MTTLYGPPNSPISARSAFHDVIDKIDAENSEF